MPVISYREALNQAMREESLTYIGPPAPASGLVDQSCFCPNCEQQAAEIRRLTASYNWLMDRYQALGSESRERIEQAEAYRDEYLAIAESRIAQINEANARAEQLERETGNGGEP